MKKNKFNELEYEQKTGDYSTERNKKFDWLILVFCVLLSVVIWLIALNANDPIIEKDLTLVCTFEGEGEHPTLTPSFQTVRVYGTESALSGVNEIIIALDPSDFAAAGVHTENIVYPDGVKPVDSKYKSVDISVNYD